MCRCRGQTWVCECQGPGRRVGSDARGISLQPFYPKTSWTDVPPSLFLQMAMIFVSVGAIPKGCGRLTGSRAAALTRVNPPGGPSPCPAGPWTLVPNGRASSSLRGQQWTPTARLLEFSAPEKKRALQPVRNVLDRARPGWGGPAGGRLMKAPFATARRDGQTSPPQRDGAGAGLMSFSLGPQGDTRDDGRGTDSFLVISEPDASNRRRPPEINTARADSAAPATRHVAFLPAFFFLFF